MKRKTVFSVLALGGVTAVALGAAAVSTAHGGGGKHGWHAGHHASFGPGGHHRGDGGPRAALRYLDANGDGALERAEAEGTLTQKLQQFDVNQDQQLTLDEFQGLWLNFTRPRMVDRFQDMDENGDGVVTRAEMIEPVERAFRRIDVNEDGTIDNQDRRAMRRLFRGGPIDPQEN
ncbi:MAG: hypothetical protein AAGC57_15825 [Pseudomonadota bacterium]